MKTKTKKTDFTKMSKAEMKSIYGGDGPKKVVVIIDGIVYIIWL
jgi:bacteriocin-like protein